MRAIILLM
uniref:Uncharacterized protein n=1 Tax=Anguilla anguilla TaxID=7936 RepID=A0A0E9TN60_ANGAN